MKQTIFHLHTLSSLHFGIGQGTGVIDLPIARERASNLPQVPGSGIKGVLRDECRVDKPTQDSSPEAQQAYNDHLALFGPEAGENASKYAGAIAVGDARLLTLPIRSWKGTFAWTTCPMVLRRYQRDLKTQGITGIPEIPSPVPNETQAQHADNTLLKSGDKIFLEDLDLTATEGAQDWAQFIAQQVFGEEEWQQHFKERFLVLSDDVFDFLSETATEIRARIQIEPNTRTVKQGALWYEEYLPAETLLWGIIAADRSRQPKHGKDAQAMLDMIPDDIRLQMGGNASVGAGQVCWIKGGQ